MSHTTSRPSRRFTKIVSLAVAPMALLVSGLIVGQASYSAYSATTVNPTSNWSTGTVALRDDDRNVAAFTASGLQPGDTGERCIVVTSTGSMDSIVKLYATGPTSTKGLSSYIDLSITQGTGGSFGSCDGYTPSGEVFGGTLEAFGARHTDYTSGVGPWFTTGGKEESLTYRISYTFSTEAPNTTQGGTASVGLTWEAQTGRTRIEPIKDYPIEEYPAESMPGQA